MPEIERDEQKINNTICFIEAARELIDTEGLENISIRKIASKAGFHNSTIYLYFKDMNQLIMLASLKDFNEYSKELSEQSKKKSSPTENFLAIWSFFGKTVLRKPNLFHNFFYGKYSDNLTDIMNQYYELFPEEREEYSDDIKDMYYGKNITERCLRLLSPLVKEENNLTNDNLELVNEIIVAFLKYLLEQKRQNMELDNRVLNERLQTMLVYTIGIPN